LFYDWALISGIVSVQLALRAAEKRDRVNLFYHLEECALASSTADHPFLVYNGRSWTYKETYELALRYGTWLKQTYNIKPREVVAMDFMNCPNFIFLWMGIWGIGATPAFINYNLTGAPLLHCLKVSTARIVLVDPEIRHHYNDDVLAALNTPDFRDGKGCTEVVYFTPETETQVCQTEPTRAGDSDRTGVLGRDVGIIIYTSGTTGLPKAAIVSWSKCIAGGTFVPRWMGWKGTDRAFTVRDSTYLSWPGGFFILSNFLTFLFSLPPKKDPP
jgi:acyl-CoA synthetase (AMP-forming)/AMP-acid ligase II